MWIDIEDANGTKLGAGPIRSATGWESAWRMSEVGAWSFEMPVLDPQCDLVRVGRSVRAWKVENRQLVELGGGVIEQRTVSVDTGVPMLQVSGDDRLRELANRTVGALRLATTVYRHPGYAAWYNAADLTTGALWDSIDGDVGDTATNDTLTLAEQKYLLVHDALPFAGVRVVLAAGGENSFEAEAVVEYWNGTAWTGLTPTTNTTLAAGAPFGQAGDITWEAPADWTPRAASSRGLYELRISQDIEGDEIAIADLSIIREEPTQTALADVMAVVSGEWTLDTINGYGSTTPTQTTGGDLLSNGGLETVTGSADDNMSDTFTGWTRGGVSDGVGNRVEATAGAYAGALALKLVHTTNASEPVLYQDVTVTEATDYLLAGWAHGDGLARPRVAVEDLTHTAGDQWLSAHVFLPAGATYAAFSVAFTTPVGCTSVRIHLLSSAASQAFGTVHFDALTLKGLRLGGVRLQMAGESVFETLLAIAEQAGEHFTLTPGGARRVLWLRDVARASGLRAIAPGNGVRWNGTDGAPEVAYIAGLEETQSRYELATRVYPRNESLAYATQALPSGWTLDKTANCLIHTAAEAVLGRIDKVLDVTDVGTTGSAPDQRQYRSNAVLAQCYGWLAAHSATDTDPITGDVPKSYSVELAKCHRWIVPGYQMRVVYSRWLEGYQALGIDADLWVLEATTKIDSRGLRLTALSVATVAAHPVKSDAELIARELRAARAARARS